MNVVVTASRVCRPQRRRRDIFVEPVIQCSTSPVGATYSVAPAGFQPRTPRTTRTKKNGSRISCISRLSCPVFCPPMPLLRSWNYFCTTCYKYAAPTALPMNVPPGQPTIARRFNGGSASSKRFKSRRDGRKSYSKSVMVCRPSGTLPLLHENPRLKPWAIIGRLAEALPGGKIKPVEGTANQTKS